MDVLELLESLVHRLPKLILLVAAAAAGAYLATFAMDESYEATALVLVRPEEQLSVGGRSGDQELLGFPVSASQSDPDTPTNTYIEIIQSRTIAERVVRSTGLDQPPPEEESNWFTDRVATVVRGVARAVVVTKDLLLFGATFPPMSDFDEALEKFQDDISLLAVEGTHLFEITFAAEDPEQAARVAGATAEIFLEYMAETNTTEYRGALQFIGQQLDEAEVRLVQARSTLRGFKEARGTVSFEEEVSEAIRLLAALEEDFDATETKLAGLSEAYLPLNPKVAQARAERDQLKRTLEQRRRGLRDLPSAESRLAGLELEVEMAEEIFSLLKRESEEARIRQAKQISEMRIVAAPVAPNYPSSPFRILYAAGAAVVALILGVGWFGAVELLDPTLRAVEQTEELLGARVLATIPPARLPASKTR
jgi:uncharacterized protein involved in exopolysaccharide biosynthesis